VICGWITRHVTVYYIAVLYERRKKNKINIIIIKQLLRHQGIHTVTTATEKKSNNLKSLYGPKRTILFLLSLGLIYILAKREEKTNKKKEKRSTFQLQKSFSISFLYYLKV